MIAVEPVRTRRQMAEFCGLDLRIYRDYPLYAPPIRYDLRKRLQKWTRSASEGVAVKREAELFLAVRDGRTVGRISTSIDHVRNEHRSDRSGAFGFLEGDDDPEIFAQLFGASEQWLRARNVSRVMGPYSFTQEDPYVGLLISGFEQDPSFCMTYSAPWYPAAVEACGYRTEMDLKSYTTESDGAIPDAIDARGRSARERPDVRVRSVDMRRIWDEAKLMRNIFNAALNENWEFVPFNDEQVRTMVQELRLLADPRLILFVEVNDQPAGCVINLPDYNDVLRKTRGRLFPTGLVRLLLAKRNRRRFRAYAMGVLKEHRRLGLGAALVYETFVRGLAAGYREAEITWILGENSPMNGLAGQFSEARGKLHRIYAKDL